MKEKRKEAHGETWETPSLEWIHRVRRERQFERAGRRAEPASPTEAAELARRYGLKLARGSAEYGL